MRGFIGLCLLVTGLSIGAYSHFPGTAQREASLIELTEIVTGATVARNATAHNAAYVRSADGGDVSIPAGAVHTAKMTVQNHKQRGWFANKKVLAAVEPLTAKPARKADKQTERVLAIKQPPTLIARHSAKRPPVAGQWRTAVVRVAAVANPAKKRTSSLAPTTSRERWKLVKALQAELKRVGCYWGKIDGVWGKGSKWAITDFMRSVNATLPTRSPDYIMLQLVSSHTAKVCGRDVDGTQIASRSAPRPSSASANFNGSWQARVALAKPDKPIGIETGSIESVARTIQTAAVKPRPAPLPGRMAIGALNRNTTPQLVGPPKRISRQALDNGASTDNANSRRVRITALPTQNDGSAFDPRPPVETNAATIEPPAQKTLKRAKAVRKAVAKKKKKKRRHYRRRHRQRSLQAIFMHPLGRR